MAKVIDTRDGGGLVVLGPFLTLPTDDQDAGITDPFNASVRYNPSTDSIEAYLPLAGSWAWSPVGISRGSNAVVFTSGARLTGDLYLTGSQILADTGTAAAPSYAFETHPGTGLSLSNANAVALTIDGTTIAWVKADGFYTANAIQAPGARLSGADLSEIYEADSPYGVGTVVRIGGLNEVTISNTYADASVVGVVSPGIGAVLNNAARATNGFLIKITTKGRAICNVRGPVTKGDLLCSSNAPGIAQTYSGVTPPAGIIIGRALQGLAGSGYGTVSIKV